MSTRFNVLTDEDRIKIIKGSTIDLFYNYFIDMKTIIDEVRNYIYEKDKIKLTDDCIIDILKLFRNSYLIDLTKDNKYYDSTGNVMELFEQNVIQSNTIIDSSLKFNRLVLRSSYLDENKNDSRIHNSHNCRYKYYNALFPRNFSGIIVPDQLTSDTHLNLLESIYQSYKNSDIEVSIIKNTEEELLEEIARLKQELEEKNRKLQEQKKLAIKIVSY